MQPLTLEELRAGVDNIDSWWHHIDLGRGIVTPGQSDCRKKLSRLDFPASLEGRSVLDVGAFDGFFSFEAERRGAKRVLAVDSPNWSWKDARSKAGFEFARRALGSRVEDAELEVLELSPKTVGVFDLVLALGILYHMRDPMLALERMASVTGDMLILETHVDNLWHRRPSLAFYPRDGIRRANWVGPNPRAVVAMLRAVGFSRVESIWVGSLPRRVYIAIRDGLLRRSKPDPMALLQQTRLVVHAYK